MHPGLGLLIVGGAIYFAWPKKSDRRGPVASAKCPTFEELDGFGRANGVAFAMVARRSELKTPEQVWTLVGQEVAQQEGWTREQFFDRFAYYVASDCSFWVSPNDGRDPWAGDGGEVLSLLRQWQKTGAVVT